MNDDLGRMAQHFEALETERKFPRLRYIAAGIALGLIGTFVMPKAFAMAIVWMASL